ncbi:hypothetical protein EGW08_019598, partial [Elysia chlorotica]
EAGGSSENRKRLSVLSKRGLECEKILRLPPFSGPHAYHVLPFDSVPGKPVTKRYQVKIFRDKMAGHGLVHEESKDVKQYATTPLAVWRQHRFSCPEGSDFRDLKEQVRLAKYRAMLSVQDTAAEEEDEVTVRSARLTSHFKPWTKKADDHPDCEDFFEDRALMARARKALRQKAQEFQAEKTRAWHEKYSSQRDSGESQGHSQGQGQGQGQSQNDTPQAQSIQDDKSSVASKGSKSSKATSKDTAPKPAVAKRGSKSSGISQQSTQASSRKTSQTSQATAGGSIRDSFFEKKPLFSVEEEFMEDIQCATEKSRKELSKFLELQPIANFIPDPKADPDNKDCFKKAKEARPKNL